MNFLVCDVPWTLDRFGLPHCSSGFRSVTAEEAKSVFSDMTWQDVADYQGEIVTLFAVVFGFLVLKKALL